MEFNTLELTTPRTNRVKLGQDLEINRYFIRDLRHVRPKKGNINHARIKTSKMTRCNILILELSRCITGRFKFAYFFHYVKI